MDLCLLRLKLGLEGGKFVSRIRAGFGEKFLVMDPDLVEVFLQGVAGDVILLFVDGLGIFGSCSCRFNFGLGSSLVGEVFYPFDDMGICRKVRGCGVGDV
jgi:hypothetical protein